MKEFLITLFLGEFGVHRFMQKKYITGAIWLCTLGVFGIGWAVDTVIAFTKMSKGTQHEKSNKFSGGGTALRDNLLKVSIPS